MYYKEWLEGLPPNISRQMRTLGFEACKTIIPFTITSTSGASQEHNLVIIKEPTLATLDSVVIDGTTVARVNNTYVAEIGKSADSVNAEITPISGTVEVLDKDRNVVSYESMNGLTWINTALPANVGTTTTYTLRVTNGNALSTVEYPLPVWLRFFQGGI